jgi:hypothetical protein
VPARVLAPAAPPLTRTGRFGGRGEEDPPPPRRRQVCEVWGEKLASRVSPAAGQHIYVSEIAGTHLDHRSADQCLRLAGRRTGPEMAQTGLGAGPIRRPNHLLSGLKPMRA